MLNKLRPLLLALPLFATACSMGPGDYVIFRVAYDAPVTTPDCGFTGVNFDQDSSTFGSPGNIALFAFEDVYFLEFGDDGMGNVVALEGERSGSNYTFSGNSVDVQEFDPATGTTTTTSYEVEVAAVIKGKNIDGVGRVVTQQVCNGSSCPPDTYPISCTTTTSFRGSSIDGTDLEKTL